MATSRSLCPEYVPPKDQPAAEKAPKTEKRPWF
jgi:hypothetical protein